VDCLHDYRLSVKIHGDEILNHANWEISVGCTVIPALTLLNSRVRLGKMAQALQVSPSFVCEDSKVDNETFCSLLVDTQTVEVVNRWRRERGDPELRVADFAKSTDHSS